MKEPLTREAWETLMQDVENGRADVYLPRNFSRHFFTHVPTSSIRSVTGNRHLGAKLLVLSCLVAGVATGFGSLYVIAVTFESLAFLAVPLVGILWTVIAGFTTEMGAGLKITIPGFIVVVALASFIPPPYRDALLMLITSLFLYRTAHLLAQHFLTGLVMASFPAWEMMEMHVTVSRDEA